MNISLDIFIPVVIAIVITYIMRNFIISYNRKLAMRRFTDSDNLSRFDKLILNFFLQKEPACFRMGQIAHILSDIFQMGYTRKKKLPR